MKNMNKLSDLIKYEYSEKLYFIILLGLLIGIIRKAKIKTNNN